jgi:hypothetical protein
MQRMFRADDMVLTGESNASSGTMKKPARLWNYAGFELVAWGGIEPPTQGFSILCSTD